MWVGVSGIHRLGVGAHFEFVSRARAKLCFRACVSFNFHACLALPVSCHDRTVWLSHCTLAFLITADLFISSQRERLLERRPDFLVVVVKDRLDLLLINFSPEVRDPR